MSYKVYIYVCMLLLSAFSISGINFNGFFKTKYVIEARIFVGLLMLALAYAASEFIISFVELM